MLRSPALLREELIAYLWLLVILPFLFSVSHFYTSPLNFLCSYDKKREASVLRQQDFSLPDHMVDIPYSRTFLLRLILLHIHFLLPPSGSTRPITAPNP